MTALRVMHFHFGREGGAERFFVNLATALAARGVDQRFVIRPGRSWAPALRALGPVMESDFSNLIRATGLVQARVAWQRWRWRPHACLGWMQRGSELLPRSGPALRVTRLGDFPNKLKHFRRTDILVGNVPGIVERARGLGWTRETRVISNFPRRVTATPLSRAAHDTPEDAFLVVTGGRFVARKGMDTALRTLAALPGAYLWIMGEGREAAALRSLTRTLGLESRTRFLGWVPEPMDALAAGDAVLMPSRHEPLGNLLIEAWQQGIPTVSTRSEGPNWFMRDGVDGLMADIDDAPALAAALAQLRDDPALAKRLAQNATARLDDMFSERAVVEAYIALLSQNRAAIDG